MAITGEVRFVANFEDDKKQLKERGALVISVKRAGRSKLADAIDDAIEIELAARGACRGVGTMDALADQTFRARHLGYGGIAIALECLRSAAAPMNALDGLDAKCLVDLAEATKERPVIVLMDENDADLRAYSGTIPLPLLFSPEPEPEPEPELEPESDEPPEEIESISFSEVVTLAVADAGAVAAAVADAVSVAVAEVREQHAPTQATLPAPPDLEPEPEDPPMPESQWRPWASSLRSARGPQTLASFERLFAQSYLPLANAIARGVSDPDATDAAEEFRRTFSRAYSEACPTFPLTAKRPKMVLDAHEVAARMARQHGARTTHLLLVSSMRWDIGANMRESLVTAIAGRGQVVGEMPLFAALPTTTWRQLEGIARGLESLRNPAEAREEDPVRGRTAEMVRRVRVGPRDVFKLDWVDAAVRASPGRLIDDLPAIAAECADIVAKHALALPARTLVLVFGDHGFSIDAEGLATLGGASPEEVIVPAFGVLVGELH